MKTEEFNQLLEQRIRKTKTTLSSKSAEYAKDDNKLHNFNRAAEITGLIREKALWGFAVKHYVSLMDILDRIDKGILPTEITVDEKIGDLINYLILLEACIIERIKNNKESNEIIE